MARTSEFIQACLDGRLADAKALVSDADVNGSDEFGRCALLTVHAEVTRLLLDHGADPNLQRSESGAAPLAGLCFDGVAESALLLLARGADPNLGRPESGETPLHHAVCGPVADDPMLKLVKALLEAGANPNVAAASGVPTDNFMRDVRVRGETPLHRAAAYAPKAVIEALLSAGADRTIRDANGDSPLSWGSFHRRNSAILKLLCFGEFRIR